MHSVLCTTHLCKSCLPSIKHAIHFEGNFQAPKIKCKERLVEYKNTQNAYYLTFIVIYTFPGLVISRLHHTKTLLY